MKWGWVLAGALVCAVAVEGATGPAGNGALLVEGAKRADAYWSKQFKWCEAGGGHPAGWYGTVDSGTETGSVEYIERLELRFQTQEVDPEARLNGVEFRALAQMESVPSRLWVASTKQWIRWQFRGMDAATVFTVTNGVFAVAHGGGYSLRALESCSDVPAMVDLKK